MFRLIKLATIAALCIASVALANHSWGSYHWYRTSGSFPVTVPISSNFTKPEWTAAYLTAVEDWNLSPDIKLSVGTKFTSPASCNPIGGTIQVCNYNYGETGWLGLTNVWSTNGHVTQATAKLNDWYFDQTRFNNPVWRSQTTCHEIGHAIGLDHQDEDFYNPPLGTCLDYVTDATPGQHPNQHDYDHLAVIYGHSHDSVIIEPTPTPTKPNRGKGRKQAVPDATPLGNNKANWGKVKRRNSKGQPDLYERDLGYGRKVLTFVHYAPPPPLP